MYGGATRTASALPFWKCGNGVVDAVLVWTTGSRPRMPTRTVDGRIRASEIRGRRHHLKQWSRSNWFSH